MLDVFKKIVLVILASVEIFPNVQNVLKHSFEAPGFSPKSHHFFAFVVFLNLECICTGTDSQSNSSPLGLERSRDWIGPFYFLPDFLNK